MRLVSSKVRATAVVAVCALVPMAGFADQAADPADQCSAAIQRAAGTYAKCLLQANAERSVSDDLDGYHNRVARCEEVFRRSHERTLNRFGADICPDNSAEAFTDTVLQSTVSIALAAANTAGEATVQLEALQGTEMASEAGPLLDEVVDFTGEVLQIELGVPGLIIVAVRGDEEAVFGFGEIKKGTDIAPDGQSLMQIGSITKVFTGEVLARLAANGTVGFADPLADYLDLGVPLPKVDGRGIRLIDLVTHSSGLPRDVRNADGSPITRQTFADWFRNHQLLFKPGSAALYSNFAFNLLSAALEDAAMQPFDALVVDNITAPLGMADTTYMPSAEQKKRLMQGYNFDGNPFPDTPSPPAGRGADGLYSTADDLVRWMHWHLDRFAAEDAEVRLLDHAAYLQRDGLTTVAGLDESGHMDAIGLGWIVMMPGGDRPFILQKAGGTKGFFSYLALAPTRGVGAFVAINEFDFAAAMSMAGTINEMISVLAPR